MKCCNPFKNLIAYVDDQLLQPSMLQRIYELSEEWEDLEARVKKLEDGEDIPDNIQQQINQLKIQVQALNNSLSNKLDTDTFNIFKTNVEESISTLESDISALKTKTNSLEQELNTQSHLITQAQQTATSAQNTANTADTNAMDALTGLDGKANADASNLTDADVTAWQAKIGSGGGGDLTEYAKRDASNLTNENSDAWVDKLGVNNKVETTEFNQYKALINVNKADSDAGNLSVADIQAWQEKLGGGLKSITFTSVQELYNFLSTNINNIVHVVYNPTTQISLTGMKRMQLPSGAISENLSIPINVSPYIFYIGGNYKGSSIGKITVYLYSFSYSYKLMLEVTETTIKIRGNQNQYISGTNIQIFGNTNDYSLTNNVNEFTIYYS